MYDGKLIARIRLRVAATPRNAMLCDQVLKLDGVSEKDLAEHAKLLIDLGEIDGRVLVRKNKQTVFVRGLKPDGWMKLLNVDGYRASAHS